MVIKEKKIGGAGRKYRPPKNQMNLLIDEN